MAHCSRCGAGLSAGTRFCPGCGTPVTATALLARESPANPTSVVIAVAIVAFAVTLALMIIVRATNSRPDSRGGGGSTTIVQQTIPPPPPPPPPVVKVVPKVVGLHGSQAKAQLEAMGFVGKTSGERYDSASPGTVLAHNPGPGESAEAGSTINLVISRGPQPVVTPAPPPPPTSTVSSTTGYFILPQSDDRELTYDDIDHLDAASLARARNEIYARHGRTFAKADYQRYFDQQSWYRRNPNYHDGLLSRIELRNANFIKDYEQGGHDHE